MHRKIGQLLPRDQRRGLQQARLQRLGRDLRRAPRGADPRPVGRAGDLAGRARPAAADCDLDGRLRPALDPLRAVSPRASGCTTKPALDPTFLPIIYEAPTDADWTRRARLAQGESGARAISARSRRCAIGGARAQEIPAQENTFRRLYLNQWTEQARAGSALAGWDACQAPIDPAARAGRRCYIGMDLSTTTDLTAVVAVFPGCRRRRAAPSCRSSSVPAERIRERVTRDRVPYDEWARRGLLIVTPGPTVDYERVRAELQRLAARAYRRAEIAFDPWNATDLVQRLEEVDGFTCVPIRQGLASLSAPTKALEQADSRRRRCATTATRCCAGISRMSRSRATRRQHQAEKAVSTERIDGVVALVMALDAMHREQPARRRAADLRCSAGSSDEPPPGRPPLDRDDPWVQRRVCAAGEGLRCAVCAARGTQRVSRAGVDPARCSLAQSKHRSRAVAERRPLDCRAHARPRLRSPRHQGGRRRRAASSGIASTPTPDRHGDIVDPLGATFAMPCRCCCTTTRPGRSAASR